MEHAIEPFVVGVRFSRIGKVYHFSANEVTDVKVGDMVVVETSRGWQLGQVAQVVQNAEPPPDGWKPIDRRATPRDLLLRQMWQMKESEVVSSARAKSIELNLVGIKIVAAEYSFDGARLTILFSSEAEEKYDLKSLRQDMQRYFAPTQVEMRQIGPRDVAKVMCGMGACGLEQRCCSLFLTEFSSISIRMAKEQGISLSPSEITGMCGRLRCCLIYEYETYMDARARLPKRNKRVRTPQGEGKVIDVVPLRGSVIVDLPEVGRREFPGEEVSLVEDGGGQQAQPVQPYRGTQQPSEIDQAIVGEAEEKPFTISEGAPEKPKDWELNARPGEEQPKTGEQKPQRGDRRSRDSQRKGPRQGRAPQGGGQQQNQPSGEQRPRERRRGPVDQQQNQQNQQTPSDRPASNRPPRNRPPQNSSPQSGSAAGGGQPGGVNRESRRRRGRRRDSDDTESRT